MPDFGGLFDVTAHGARADGASDCAPALAALARAVPPGGGTLYFPPGDYALGADLTIPAHVTLHLVNGAHLSPRADTRPVLTIRGALEAGLHPIFAPGLTVRFAPPGSGGTNQRAAFLADTLPEWWGARGDGAADDWEPMQSCIDACCGFPFESFVEPLPRGATLPTTKGPPRWATARVRLAPGAVYRVTRPLRIVSVVGFAITGAGIENSIIRAQGTAPARAAAATAITLTQSGARWEPDALRGMWVCITAGAALGQSARIEANTAGQITFAPAMTPPPAAGSTFVILPEAVLDLDGCFEGSFDRFSVEGAPTSGAYTGIYYHRDPALTARGSSSTNFAFVKVGGLTWEAAWQVGGLGSAYDPWQEDITEFLNCRARGQGGPAYGGPWFRNGWVFGTGTFANNLNHVVHGIDAVGYGYNVSVRATNVAIYGGTLQSAAHADIQVVNGLQGYFTASGIRSEESRAFLEYVYNPYSVFWSLRLADIEIDGPSLVASPTGGGNVITSAAHYTELTGIRILNPPMLVKQQATSGTRTSVSHAGANWAPHRFAGYTWVATAGTGKGQTADVAESSADTLTFRDPLATAPDATTQWDVFLRPVIRLTKDGTQLRMSGVGIAGGTIEKSLVVTAHAVAGVHATVEGFAELTVADAIVATLWPGPILLGPPGGAPGAALTFGEIGQRPDCTLARTGPGSLQLGATSDARLGFFGATPVARPRVGGGSTGDVLRSLIEQLAALGLISDGTR